jgi:hypothetical protein
MEAALRHLSLHLLAGSLGGVTAAGGIVATNVGSLRDLMECSHDGWLSGALLAFGFAVTFGGAALAWAIHLLGEHR